MDDIFISYSRKDKAFATRLHEALQARQREAWVDLEDIPPTAEWREKIHAGIEGARAFVFILSPDSMASPECRMEVDHAAAIHKRLIPVVCREVDPQAAPEALGKLNWIFLREQDDFAKGIDTLLTAVDTDLDWVDAHTTLLEKATEWDRKARDKSLLLRGGELRAAEDWQVKSATKEPKPTELMAAFIVSSRHGETRRQRYLLGGVSAGLVVALVLAGIAWYQRGVAKQRGQIALSRQLAAQADNLKDTQLDLAMLLSVEAVKASLEKPTAEARDVLLGALQKSPQLLRYVHAHKDTKHRSVAFSPDGKTLASGGLDQTIIVWDVETGQKKGDILKGHEDTLAYLAVRNLAFSRDGNTLSSWNAANDSRLWFKSTIRLWDRATGQSQEVPLADYEYGMFVEVALSPDGNTLASGDTSGTIRLWDVATGQPRGAPLIGHQDAVSRVTLSPDDKALASMDTSGTISIWDVATGQPRGAPLIGHQDAVSRVAFSPDGKTLASMGRGRGTLILWDVATGQVLGPLLTGRQGGVHYLAFSPDGKTLASGSWRTIFLWDVATGQPRVVPLIGHEDGVLRGAFSPDGNTLALMDKDTTIRLWEVSTGQPWGAPLIEPQDKIYRLVFSPDSHTLASAAYNTMSLWDLSTGLPQRIPLTGPLRYGGVHMAFSPDGKTLAAGNMDISLWDVATGQPRGTILTGHESYLTSIAFRPDGNTLASGSNDYTIRFWNIATGHLKGAPLTGHEGPVVSVVFSPDGKTLASGGSDIRLWDVATGQVLGPLLTGRQGGVHYLAFSPDGKTLASGSWRTIFLWDVATGQPLGSPLEGHEKDVVSGAFSPDGKILASWSGDKIRLWDVSLESWMNRACSIANRNLTPEEWRRYMGGEVPYRRTCPDPLGPKKEQEAKEKQ
jgi:WD40 repeat protein